VQSQSEFKSIAKVRSGSSGPNAACQSRHQALRFFTFKHFKPLTTIHPKTCLGDQNPEEKKDIEQMTSWQFLFPYLSWSASQPTVKDLPEPQTAWNVNVGAAALLSTDQSDYNICQSS